MKNQNSFNLLTGRMLSYSSLIKSILTSISISSFTILFCCGCMSSSILKEPGVSENTQHVQIYYLSRIDSVTIDGVSIHDIPSILLISAGPHEILGEYNYTTRTYGSTHMENYTSRGYDQVTPYRDIRQKRYIEIKYDFKEGTAYKFVLRDENNYIDPHIETASRFWNEYAMTFGIWISTAVSVYTLYWVFATYIF